VFAYGGLTKPKPKPIAMTRRTRVERKIDALGGNRQHSSYISEAAQKELMRR
jgi:hypothetical protein